MSASEAPPGGVAYWRARAKELGAHAVLSTDHAGADVDDVSEGHRAALLPVLATLLPFAPGPGRTALDLGCGTGRLTADLAALVGGRAIGVDPVAELLAAAPASPGVEFRPLAGADAPLPLDDAEVDLAFTCLVLGGIADPDALAALGAELERVLSPGGVVVLVESVSTSPRPATGRSARSGTTRPPCPGRSCARRRASTTRATRSASSRGVARAEPTVCSLIDL